MPHRDTLPLWMSIELEKLAVVVQENVQEKVETYDKEIEVAATELAANPRSTPQQRAAFAITVVSTATATADYLIRRALEE